LEHIIGNNLLFIKYLKVFKLIVVIFCRMQIFLWNNIFLSLGFDVKDHFKDFGGDAAAYVAPVQIIQ